MPRTTSTSKRCKTWDHVWQFAPCGHLYCSLCAPEAFDQAFTCGACVDAENAADDLLDEYPHLYG